MDPLLSVDELAAIRDVGVAGMITSIALFRQDLIEPFDPVYGYTDVDPAYDYGDDELTQSTGEPQTGDPVVIFNGWIVSTPLTRDNNAGAGQIDTPNTLTMRYPVGTDVKAADIARVVSTGVEYIVIDTNADDSWPEWGKATIRSRE